MAAMAVSCQVAREAVSCQVAREELSNLGETVGYKVPFENCSNRHTVLKFLTDCMLLTESLLDPLLKSYSVIILDEVHERTTATDLLFGILKDALRERSDLKLVVMTIPAGTLTEKIQHYFSHAPLLQVPRGLYPVKTIYTEMPSNSFLNETVDRVVNILETEQLGHILVIVPGDEYIEDVCRRVTEKAAKKNLVRRHVKVLPLYSAPTLDMLENVFENFSIAQSYRKIVVTTSIVETSITIKDVVYVVDSGYISQRVYNDCSKTTHLVLQRISKASAEQRSNRAGDTKSGKVFRMYTDRDFKSFPSLYCKAMEQAMKNLYYLDVLNKKNQLIPGLDVKLIDFPLGPHMGKMLIESVKLKCSNEILSICSMLSVPCCFIRPSGYLKAADLAKSRFDHLHGDHLSLLKVFQTYIETPPEEAISWCESNFLDYNSLNSAELVMEELKSYMQIHQLERCSTTIDDPNIRKSLVAGYFHHIAHLDTGGYYSTLSGNQVVNCDPSTCLTYEPKWIIYHDFVESPSWNLVRTVSAVEEDWILEYGFWNMVDDILEGRI